MKIKPYVSIVSSERLIKPYISMVVNERLIYPYGNTVSKIKLCGSIVSNDMYQKAKM